MLCSPTNILYAYKISFPSAYYMACPSHHLSFHQPNTVQYLTYSNNLWNWLRTGRPDDRSSIPGRGKGFFLLPLSRPALGPTQPPVQWVPGVLSPGLKCCRGVTLTTHPHLMPRSGMSRSYTCSAPKRLRTALLLPIMKLLYMQFCPLPW
jgi:hypothetical protein